MAKIVAIGELLIDFTPYGADTSSMLYQCNPGGAPANVLAMAAKLGVETAMIAKVGRDGFGDFLVGSLQKEKIDTTAVTRTREALTTLAFVTLDESGNRSFSFCRKPGADILLSEEDVPVSLISGASIFHFGSLSFTDEPARGATLSALGIAREKNLIISYDPNLRPDLWTSLDEARKQMLVGLSYADIVKISEEELYFISQCSDFEEGVRWFSEKGTSMFFVTLGSKGCYYQWHRHSGFLPAYEAKAVDTTGAGDAFFGAVLYRICNIRREELSELSGDEVKSIADFANAAGALTVSKKGAIPALPSARAIANCMKTKSRFK
jgi:fructokinase